MKSISVHMPEDEYRELKALASRQRRPAAALLRDATREYLLRARGTGDSLLSIGAEDVDEVLDEAWNRNDVFEEMTRQSEDNA